MLDYDDDEGEEDEYYDDNSAGAKGENWSKDTRIISHATIVELQFISPLFNFCRYP